MSRARFYFHGKRHPRELGEAEITAFLNHLHVLNKGGRGVKSPLDARA